MHGASDRGGIPRHGLKSPPDDNLPFGLHPLEFMPPAAKAGYPHRHDFYQVLYLTGGKGIHVVDFALLPVDPPCLYFISPGQVHYWDLDEPLAGKVMLFTQDLLLLWPGGDQFLAELSFYHSLDGPFSLHLSGADAGTFADLIQHLEEEHCHLRFGRSSVIPAYLRILLVHAQRQYQQRDRGPPSPGGSPQVVRRFKKMVSERCLTDRRVARYADAMSITAGHLSDTVKAVTGRTAGQLIREEVVLEAKRQLAHSELTVAEIAYGLTFEDPAYFGRFFRRETGQSPGAFRRDFREKYQWNR